MLLKVSVKITLPFLFLAFRLTHDNCYVTPEPFDDTISQYSCEGYNKKHEEDVHGGLACLATSV